MGNPQLTTDRTAERIGNLAVPRDRRTQAVCGVLEDGMAVPFAGKQAAVPLEMANRVASWRGGRHLRRNVLPRLQDKIDRLFELGLRIGAAGVWNR